MKAIFVAAIVLGAAVSALAQPDNQSPAVKYDKFKDLTIVTATLKSHRTSDEREARSKLVFDRRDGLLPRQKTGETR
jgi:hypothetical protein